MSKEKRFLVIGAHPDNAGYHIDSGIKLAERRLKETKKVVKRSGIEGYSVLNHHDGELIPSIENRKEIASIIRGFRPDFVITHRTYDYPDHRATAQLVQDSAYLVMVPLFCPESPVPAKEPIYLFSYDSFKRPYPFLPDLVVNIDDVVQVKLEMMDSYESQFYEWLPHIDGIITPVPENLEEKLQWLVGNYLGRYTEQALLV